MKGFTAFRAGAAGEIVCIQGPGTIGDELEYCAHIWIPGDLEVEQLYTQYNKLTDKQLEKLGWPTFVSWLTTYRGCMPAKFRCYHTDAGFLD